RLGNAGDRLRSAELVVVLYAQPCVVYHSRANHGRQGNRTVAAAAMRQIRFSRSVIFRMQIVGRRIGIACGQAARANDLIDLGCVELVADRVRRRRRYVVWVVVPEIGLEVWLGKRRQSGDSRDAKSLLGDRVQTVRRNNVSGKGGTGISTTDGIKDRAIRIVDRQRSWIRRA